MSNNNYDPRNNEIASWIAIVVAFVVFWPVGIFLLLRKLGSSPSKRPRSGAACAPPPVRPAASRSQPARPAHPRPAKLNPNAGRGLIIGGACVAGFFGCVTLSEFFETISVGLLYALSECAPLFFFTGVGAAMMLFGRQANRRNRMYRRYLSLAGTRDAVGIQEIVQITGLKYDRVCDELQEMIDQGVFGDYAFLDLAHRRLVLTPDGVVPPEPEPRPEPKAAPEDGEDALLRQIRAANDAIADDGMSAKIDRIESITRRILACQKEHPEKSSQLRVFLNYYLPTTLKMLNAYSEMERQGIEGENISAAKERIEAVMNKLVEGFETQLDKLYADDLLDITSDIAVMEKMMAKDGLSGDGLGPIFRASRKSASSGTPQGGH